MSRGHWLRPCGLLVKKQVMGTHSSFAEDQLLVAPQTFQVDEGRDGDQLTSRLGLGNGPFS